MRDCTLLITRGYIVSLLLDSKIKITTMMNSILATNDCCLFVFFFHSNTDRGVQSDLEWH